MSIDSENEINYKFNELSKHLNEDLEVTAQGGNFIRLIYPPREEKLYLERLKESYPDEAHINVGKLFVKMIDSYGPDKFLEIFRHYKSQPEKVFQSKSSKEPNLLEFILDAIKEADDNGKTPFLIRTGALHGTGIRLNTVTKTQVVSELTNPLVIFYPAKETEGNPLFLNIRRTSDYMGQTI